MNDFESMLQQVSPEMYRIYKVGEAERHFWTAFNEVLNMQNNIETGNITIRIIQGRIDRIDKQQCLTYGRKQKDIEEDLVNG